MERFTALREYQIEYFHALRNGLTSEAAADRALTRLKQTFRESLAERGDLLELDIQKQWGDVYRVLIEWQMLLAKVPIDTAKLPKKGDPLPELPENYCPHCGQLMPGIPDGVPDIGDLAKDRLGLS